MLTLQKLWAVQWVWPITAYVFILYSEIRTNLSYGHPRILRCPDKRGWTVHKTECSNVLLISAAFEHSVLCIMVCAPHRLQCRTPHFPKHKFPLHATRNVQTHLESTVLGNSAMFNYTRNMCQIDVAEQV